MTTHASFHHPADDPAVAQAAVARDGVLLSADPVLVALNTRAGGMIGAPLAVPQLAAITKLSQRLGIIVSRGTVIADDDVDIDLWVRAQPDGDHIRLTVSGWREVQPSRAPASPRRAVLDFQATGADLRWETDASLHLTFVSLDAGTRYGFDPLALLGQPISAMVALDADQNEGAAILDALSQRRPLAMLPARFQGTGLRVRLSAETRHDAHGAFAGYVGGVQVVTDLTAGGERGVVEARPESDQLSPTFTAGLDRALRKPLARIVANADSIHAQADGPVRHDYADYASDIANAGRHLLALVDDLVDLQAVERPDFTLLPEPIDVADIARRAAGLLSVRAANADVGVARPAFDASITAQGDFRRVLQILVNLIGNAVRYSPKGGTVVVTASTEGDRATVTVADEGKGVALADQTRIFEKFERVDPSEPGGNGLGLYIARRLARAMRGDLTIDSAAGEGARFVLTLPTQAARDQDQHQP